MNKNNNEKLPWRTTIPSYQEYADPGIVFYICFDTHISMFMFSKYKYHLRINNTINWDTDLYLLQFSTNPPYSCSRSPREVHTFRQRIKTHDDFDIPIWRIAIIIDVMKEDTHGLCRQFFSRQGCPARPRPSYILYITLYIKLSYVLYNISGKTQTFSLFRVSFAYTASCREGWVLHSVF